MKKMRNPFKMTGEEMFKTIRELYPDGWMESGNPYEHKERLELKNPLYLWGTKKSGMYAHAIEVGCQSQGLSSILKPSQLDIITGGREKRSVPTSLGNKSGAYEIKIGDISLEQLLKERGRAKPKRLSWRNFHEMTPKEKALSYMIRLYNAMTNYPTLTTNGTSVEVGNFNFDHYNRNFKQWKAAEAAHGTLKESIDKAGPIATLPELLRYRDDKEFRSSLGKVPRWGDQVVTGTFGVYLARGDETELYIVHEPAASLLRSFLENDGSAGGPVPDDLVSGLKRMAELGVVHPIALSKMEDRAPHKKIYGCCITYSPEQDRGEGLKQLVKYLRGGRPSKEELENIHSLSVLSNNNSREYAEDFPNRAFAMPVIIDGRNDVYIEDSTIHQGEIKFVEQPINMPLSDLQGVIAQYAGPKTAHALTADIAKKQARDR